MLTTAVKSLARTAFSLRSAAASRCYFSSEKPFDPAVTTGLSTNQVISKNVGVNKFLSTVYTTTGLAFGGALATSYTVLSVPALATIMWPLSLAGALASVVGFVATSYMQPKYLV